MHRGRDCALQLRRVIAALTLLVVAVPAFAAGQPPVARAGQMQFVVVRSDAQGCEPTCPEWISAGGTIDAKTPALLKRLLTTLARRKLPIVVSSTGGDADAAMAVGRMIRKSGLSVAVARTSFVGCQPEQKDCTANAGKGARYFGGASPDGASCRSACLLMLAGGVRRLAGEGPALGSIDLGGMSKKAKRKLRAYLDEMGVDQAILDPHDGQQLLWSMFTAHLLTSTFTVDLITAGESARASRRPTIAASSPFSISRPGGLPSRQLAAMGVGRSGRALSAALWQLTASPIRPRRIGCRLCQFSGACGDRHNPAQYPLQKRGNP